MLFASGLMHFFRRGRVPFRGSESRRAWPPSARQPRVAPLRDSGFPDRDFSCPQLCHFPLPKINPLWGHKTCPLLRRGREEGRRQGCRRDGGCFPLTGGRLRGRAVWQPAGAGDSGMTSFFNFQRPTHPPQIGGVESAARGDHRSGHSAPCRHRVTARGLRRFGFLGWGFFHMIGSGHSASCHLMRGCERIPLRHRSNPQEKNNIVIPEFSAWLTLVLEQCRAENIRNLPRQRAPTPLFPERRPREACSMPISGCHDLPLATFNLPSRNNLQNKPNSAPQKNQPPRAVLS